MEKKSFIEVKDVNKIPLSERRDGTLCFIPVPSFQTGNHQDGYCRFGIQCMGIYGKPRPVIWFTDYQQFVSECMVYVREGIDFYAVYETVQCLYFDCLIKK